MSIESIVNQSLDLIGYKRHIGNIWDGSPAARVALNAFAQTRDEVLSAAPWDFARVILLLEADPREAPMGFLFSWTRPASAITVLDVYTSVPDLLDPQPSLWIEATMPSRIIFTRYPAAAATITNRITDVTLWTPEFTLAVIRGLAEKLQHPLMAVPKDQQDESRGRSK